MMGVGSQTWCENPWSWTLTHKGWGKIICHLAESVAVASHWHEHFGGEGTPRDDWKAQFDFNSDYNSRCLLATHLLPTFRSAVPPKRTALPRVSLVLGLVRPTLVELPLSKRQFLDEPCYQDGWPWMPDGLLRRDIYSSMSRKTFSHSTSSRLLTQLDQRGHFFTFPNISWSYMVFTIRHRRTITMTCRP